MKRHYFLIIFIILCTNCQKRPLDIITHQINNSEQVQQLINDDVDTVINQIEQQNNDIILEIIENYVSGFAFMIEGNFTGSGNKEIIGFYEIFFTNGNIYTAFCFVCDSSGKKIESIYEIKYSTGEFNEVFKNTTGLNEKLGKFIIWRDQIIGCFSDFNKNGKDELYLFTLSGVNFRPNFYEFNGIEFIEIIEFEWAIQITFNDINAKESIITMNNKIPLEHMYNIPMNLPLNTDLIENNNSYIWNEDIQKYEILSTKQKYFRWDNNLKQYEEIDQ